MKSNQSLNELDAEHKNIKRINTKYSITNRLREKYKPDPGLFTIDSGARRKQTKKAA